MRRIRRSCKMPRHNGAKAWSPLHIPRRHTLLCRYCRRGPACRVIKSTCRCTPFSIGYTPHQITKALLLIHLCTWWSFPEAVVPRLGLALSIANRLVTSSAQLIDSTFCAWLCNQCALMCRVSALSFTLLLGNNKVARPGNGLRFLIWLSAFLGI